MTTAPIFDLKRMAVHDGPGIRTSLLLKGCPLHCLWCHNPEGIAVKPELGIRLHKCVHCGACMTFCDCHRVTAETHELDRSRCVGCGRCISVCSVEALVHYGKSVSPGEILPALLADRIFFEESGGGVTLSGGEPLLHADFCVELLKLLKQERINCAVDTCGAVPWGDLERTLPYTDLFLYDFKHPVSEDHRRLTGCGNEKIIENLRRLGELRCPVEIRIPLIPGMNTGIEVLKRSAEILAGIPSITAVRLLEYHDLSRSKYRSVGREYLMPDTLPITPEELARGAEILHSFRLNVLLPDD